MFTIIIDKFFRKMKLDRVGFDFKYVSGEIMSNLSLAQDYPTVFTIQGTFSCLLYFLAKLIYSNLILHVLSSVHIFQNYPSFEANSFVSKSLNSDLAKHFVGPDGVQTVCIGYQQTTKVVTSR